MGKKTPTFPFSNVPLIQVPNWTGSDFWKKPIDFATDKRSRFCDNSFPNFIIAITHFNFSKGYQVSTDSPSFYLHERLYPSFLERTYLVGDLFLT